MSADTLSPRSVRARNLVLGLLALGLAGIFVGSLVYRLDHPNMQKQVRSQASMPAGMGQGGAAPGGMDMDQVRQMIAGLEARVNDNPHDFEAMFQLAEIELMRQDREGALAWLDKAWEHSGDDPAVLHQLSQSYFQLTANEQARDVLLRLVELDPGDGYARYNLGVLYRYRMDEDALAAEQFQAVLGCQGPDLEEIKEHARQELETLGAATNQ